MTKRRLFIAVNLPENIKKKLIDYQRKWIELDPKYIHWVRESNLHITLVFIGYVGDEEMLEICHLAKEVIGKYLLFQEKPTRSFVDSLSHWFSQKIPLDTVN